MRLNRCLNLDRDLFSDNCAALIMMMKRMRVFQASGRGRLVGVEVDSFRAGDLHHSAVQSVVTVIIFIIPSAISDGLHRTQTTPVVGKQT